jgi:hypothetical protein
MHDRLVDVLGEEVAGLVMEHLPPTGWADVATKRDLDQFAATTKSNFEHFTALLRAEMATGNATLAAELRQEMVHQTRTMIFTLVPTIIAALGTVAAIAH